MKLAQKGDSDGLFSLLGNNVTRGALKSLVTDKPSPITLKLAQVESKFRKAKSTSKSSKKAKNGKKSTKSSSTKIASIIKNI